MRFDHVARRIVKRESLHHVIEDKCWPPYTQLDMSHEHEQKHLLHNRSNCRYRDCPQTPRIILSWF